MTGCTDVKNPHHCAAFLSLGPDKILMSGIKSEECCNVRVWNLVNYQVKLFSCSRNRS